jgi:MFS family permease
LGLVSFATGFPSWLFTLFGGVIADRFPRRKIMMIIQVANMLLALTLAGLVLSGVVRPWMIVLLAFLLGTVGAFESPVRQSFLTELVDREDIPNGIALNSSMYNLGTVLGPAAGGLVYAAVGPGWCFLFNGLTYIGSFSTLLLMRIQPVIAAASTESPRRQMAEGLRYIASHAQIRYLIIIMGVMSMFVFGSLSMLPAWARDVLHGDSTTFGLLNSARGMGSLVTALTIASISHLPIRGKILMTGLSVMPLLILALSVFQWLPAAMLIMAGIGIAMLSQGNIANALVQINVPDHLRGRVMGTFMMVFNGCMPFGSLAAGALAEWIGPPATLALAGCVLLVFALYTWLRGPDLRSMG